MLRHRNGFAQGLSLRAWDMYIDVSFSSLAPQLNILVNDIPIVQVAYVLCRASASIGWSLSQI